jgi:hypothetical protein
VEHLGAALEAVEAVRQDVLDLGSRLEELEASHNALCQEVENKAEPAAAADAGAGEVKALEERVQGWMSEVEARLDTLQARPANEPGGSRTWRSDVERIAKAAVEETMQRNEGGGAVQHEELGEWQRQLLEEFEAWKSETIMDAAKVSEKKRESVAYTHTGIAHCLGHCCPHTRDLLPTHTRVVLPTHKKDPVAHTRERSRCPHTREIPLPTQQKSAAHTHERDPVAHTRGRSRCPHNRILLHTHKRDPVAHTRERSHCPHTREIPLPTHERDPVAHTTEFCCTHTREIPLPTHEGDPVAHTRERSRCPHNRNLLHTHKRDPVAHTRERSRCPHTREIPLPTQQKSAAHTQERSRCPHNRNLLHTHTRDPVAHTHR